MILSESKRDDLLLPYIEMLRAKGINCTLGQFKSYMLKKLTNEARMRNLSLGSNFYLAGAVRYYFNGDLTLNKDLDVYNNGQTKNDVWNEDVCQKLNALINILRNAYIDTIGETFEQPEDFGTLTLPKLLRKYGKKIQKELDANGGLEIDGNNENDGLDRNDRVGHNYSYEIIYSYRQATKYNQYTDPGAWCITYAKNHYDSYIKMLNIHYVIFKQDGFENVKREFGPDWTSQKPQDEYGCSLIAVLQSNKNGEPIYITSRWNHGYEKHCEADHAFTKEEFFAKTGVNDDDLQRIFAIWKNDAPKYSEDEYNVGGSVSKEEKLDALRKLKYAQMRINGGDMNVSDTIKILINLNGSQDEIVEGKAKITKGTYWCRTAFQGTCFFYFLMDKGKIVFETFLPDSVGHECYSSNIIGDGIYRSRILNGYTNLAVIIANRFIMLYDLRRHCIINIDGEIKFKGIPKGGSDTINNKSFYEVRYDKKQFALLNTATNIPLKLPNGRYWINHLRSNFTSSYGNIFGNSNLQARKHNSEGGGGEIFEIIYDASSGERYFYDVDKRTFLSGDNIPQPEDPQKIYKLYTDFRMPGAIAFKTDSKYSDICSDYYYSRIKLMINGEFFTIDGCSEFKGLMYCWDNLLIYDISSNSPYMDNSPKMMYDLQSKSNILNPETGDAFKFPQYPDFNAYNMRDSRFLYFTDAHLFRMAEGSKYGKFIFDKKIRSLLKNPCGFPGPYTFAIIVRGNNDGSGIVIACDENAVGTWNLRQKVYAGDVNAVRRSYRILSIPGVDNSNPYPPGDFYDIFNNAPRLEVEEPSQKYSVDDIQQMVREAVNRILSENIETELQAWHGGQADFNKFDMSYMGTGEGNQTYGWGIYLTDVKDTGRWYAATISVRNNKNVDKNNHFRTILELLKTASKKPGEKRDTLVREMTPENFETNKNIIINNLSTKLQKASGKVKAAIQDTINYITPLNSKDEINQLIINLTHKAASKYKRIVYTVDIPDTGYLDWTNTDKVLLKNLFDKFSQKFDTSHVNFNNIETFGDLYKQLRGWDFKCIPSKIKIPQKDLSLFLLSLGYVGIRVPTGFQRGGDGRGTNIVMFDANDVKIIKKENLQGRENF